MADNLNQIILRGEKLKNLADDTDKLEEGSYDLYENAKTLNRQQLFSSN